MTGDKDNPGMYSGILVRPVRSRYGINTLADFRRAIPGDEEWEKEQTWRIEDIAQQEAERLVALFDHFGLDVGDWRTLAFSLARQHVPGFRRRPFRKRKRYWDDVRYLMLWRDVQVLFHQEKASSVREACRVLGRTKDWRGKKRLREHYYEALKTEAVELEVKVWKKIGAEAALKHLDQFLEQYRRLESGDLSASRLPATKNT